MNKIKKEVGRFLIAGVSAVSTDFISYNLMLNYLSNELAKALSFLLGTVVAFIINKYWTFEKKELSYNEMCRFITLYTITLTANVMINQLLVNETNLIHLAFLIATGVSTVLNFIGQKLWVFK